MGTIKVLLFLCVAGSCYCEDSHNVGIRGGHQIDIEDAPFMASLRLGMVQHWCGASIVHERFILTAAHCIKPDNVFDVMVGTDLIDGEDGTRYDIQNYIIHEKYNKTSFDFNVCLIKLSEPLVLGKKVKVIELADHKVTLPKGTMLNMTGWGQPNIEDFSNHMLQVSLPKVALNDCQYFYNDKEINENMICAGKKGKNLSFGDIGGPLTLGNVQVGVSSFGRGYGTSPSVYTKIQSVHQWIKENIRKNLQN